MHGFQKFEGGKHYSTLGMIARGRYHNYPKTVGDRWRNEGVYAGGQRVHFPPPDMIINQIQYWADQTVDQFDGVLTLLTKGKPLPAELAALVEEWQSAAELRKATTA
jgi:hypothetical protein